MCVKEYVCACVYVLICDLHDKCVVGGCIPRKFVSYKLSPSLHDRHM